jgi:hypothetical protein
MAVEKPKRIKQDYPIAYSPLLFATLRDFIFGKQYLIRLTNSVFPIQETPHG